MILNQDKTGELMINMVTGQRFVRPLSEEELEEVKNAEKQNFARKIIDAVNLTDEEKIEMLQEIGMDLEDMLNFIMDNYN